MFNPLSAAEWRDMASDGIVCANIGPRQIRRRWKMGVIGGTVALVTLAALLYADAPRAARLILFVPLWTAALGFLQAREKT